MKYTFTTLAASLALACASGAWAQQASGSAAAGGQDSQQNIDQQYKATMEKCNGMKGNAKDICKAEADGQKKVAEAQAKFDQRNTPKNWLELQEAKAEAQYGVAKERCDDQVGEAKKACQKEAKATHDLVKAQASKQAQAAGSSVPGATSSGGGQESGGSASGSPSSSQSGGAQQQPSSGGTPASQASPASSGTSTMSSGSSTPGGSSSDQPAAQGGASGASIGPSSGSSGSSSSRMPDSQSSGSAQPAGQMQSPQTQQQPK